VHQRDLALLFVADRTRRGVASKTSGEQLADNGGVRTAEKTKLRCRDPIGFRAGHGMG
jgi:hypothetical protein